MQMINTRGDGGVTLVSVPTSCFTFVSPKFLVVDCHCAVASSSLEAARVCSHFRWIRRLRAIRWAL